MDAANNMTIRTLLLKALSLLLLIFQSYIDEEL